MPRKKIKWTEKKVNEFIKEGRGQGEGAEYKPWIKVGEFSSLGRSHRIKVAETDGMHHFFSDIEKDYYYYILWNDKITDIREQYPLFPVSETEEIAKALKVTHPEVNGINIVMTTDFIFSSEGKLFARSIKYSEDLNDIRKMNKLKIEKIYWRKRDIEYKVVTETSFSRIVSKNAQKLFGYFEEPFNNYSLEMKKSLKRQLILKILNNENKKLSDLCIDRDLEEFIVRGSNLTLFWHLASRKIIPVKMEEEINPTNKVCEIIDLEKLSNMMAEENYNEHFA